MSTPDAGELPSVPHLPWCDSHSPHKDGGFYACDCGIDGEGIPDYTATERAKTALPSHALGSASGAVEAEAARKRIAELEAERDALRDDVERHRSQIHFLTTSVRELEAERDDYRQGAAAERDECSRLSRENARLRKVEQAARPVLASLNRSLDEDGEWECWCSSLNEEFRPCLWCKRDALRQALRELDESEAVRIGQASAKRTAGAAARVKREMDGEGA